MTIRRRITVLAEITRALSRGDAPDEIIRIALGAVQRAIHADVVAFASSDGSRIKFVIREGGEVTTAVFDRDPGALTESVMTTGEPLLIDDLMTSEMPLRRLAGVETPHARAYIGVPALSGKRVIGVLSVQSYRPGVFDAGDVGVISDAGRLVADAIVSSRRMARVQRRLTDLDRTQRERTDFLVGVAHDMRSPLAGIIGFARILEEMDVIRDDDMAAEAVAFIASESQRLSDLVAELVDLGRVDLGDTGLERENLDLRRVVNQAVDSVRIRFPSHRFVVRAAEAVTVEADLVRVHRVVMNLVENAAVHGPVAGLVTIETHRDGDAAVVAVSDRGPGVPPGERVRIFERFVRLDDSTAGSGIGLYLTRGLVEAHGGTIAVEDAPGGGSRFVVRLPMGSVNGPLPVP